MDKIAVSLRRRYEQCGWKFDLKIFSNIKIFQSAYYLPDAIFLLKPIEPESPSSTITQETTSVSQESTSHASHTDL